MFMGLSLLGIILRAAAFFALFVSIVSGKHHLSFDFYHISENSFIF